KGYITRQENQPVQGEVSSPVTLPAQALRSDAPDVQEYQTLPHSRLVYVVSETKAEPPPSLQKSPPTFLKPFVAGVCAALLAVSVAIPGWQFLTQPSPEEQHFTWGEWL
ncbi:type VI secretion protein ImpA, partial [Escherichia coli]|nr:type VI secretion protein ImpA [Escherichia coli]EFE0699645.1 type VI secretion protein ImpA [Escherichia coli]